MSTPDPDRRARALAAEGLAADDPSGWFERLYAEARTGDAVVPWDRGSPHQLLAEWAEAHRPDGAGKWALVVGCGLGRDSEFVAGLGFGTVAFDVSETAVRTARDRHPDSPVEYRQADLLAPPEEWRRAFDLVVESMTVQSLPAAIRPDAIAAVPEFVAPGGMLLVIAAAREADEPADGPPWPLTRAEIEAFATGGLEPVRIEDVPATEEVVRRWRVEFHRPS